MQLSSIEQVWVSASAPGEIGLRYYWSDQPTETQTPTNSNLSILQTGHFTIKPCLPPYRIKSMIKIIISDPAPDWDSLTQEVYNIRILN